MKNRILTFLEELRVNNNREWFGAHKERYQQVKDDAEQLAAELIAAIYPYDNAVSRLMPSDCTYRIYRDTRFSSDKTPYKTHVGIFVNPLSGKKGETMGYYLHLEPGNSLFAVGTGWSSPEVLRAIRRGIYAEIDEYREIVESDDFRDVFTELGQNCLKTAPKGFPKEWPYVDYLKPRRFGATVYLPDAFFEQKDWMARLDKAFEQGAKLNRFLNFFVEETMQ